MSLFHHSHSNVCRIRRGMADNSFFERVMGAGVDNLNKNPDKPTLPKRSDMMCVEKYKPDKKDDQKFVGLLKKEKRKESEDRGEEKTSGGKKKKPIVF